ncbi:MAG: hypothetical protein RL701_2711, partial [Pseudomonadota bacterium]
MAWVALVGGCAEQSTAAPWVPAPPVESSTDTPSAQRLIPAHIRRLSNAEYNGSVASLLKTALAPGDGFAPDKRQAGFSVNEAQRVDTVLALQLYAAAEQLTAAARERFDQLAPCAPPSDSEVCASAFIASFGARAYRRPLIAAESAGLLDVYRAGALDARYADGIELVLRALLQSAGFLYLTELGDAPPDHNGAIALTGYELASSLSYLITGAPPDAALLEAAAAGALDSA